MLTPAADLTGNIIYETAKYLRFLPAPPPGAESANKTELAVPHKVFRLPYGSSDLRDAKFAAWRFLIYADDVPIAAATATTVGERVAVTVGYGPVVQQTHDALNDDASHEALGDGYVEFRLLRIPEIYVAAAWLTNTNGEARLISLSRFPRTLTNRTAVAPEEFFRHITESGAKPFTAINDPESGERITPERLHELAHQPSGVPHPW
jgi:hypothetical protein